MIDATALFSTLRQSVDKPMADAIEELVLHAPDSSLNRVNPLHFAQEHHVEERDAIGAFLHGTRIGLFELTWSVLCPSCAGTLHTGASLQTVDEERYACAFCARDSEPTLDETVEVTFTVNPRVRRIASHDPEKLPLWDYLRQVYWSSGVDLPDALQPGLQDTLLSATELPAYEVASHSLTLPVGIVIVFDPVTHMAQFLQVDGLAAESPQELTIAIEGTHGQRAPVSLRPGALSLTVENKTAQRVLPTIWVVGDGLLDFVGRRIPFLTAKRLLTHQVFRDIYRTEILNIDQRFKIMSLTFLFTDLKGSTELYERIGDLAAYDLVRAHFRALTEIVADEAGAVVKTIGDAVMATFATPKQGLSAALRMRDAMDDLNKRLGREDILLKIGLHEGPCLAVALNDRQDYFGQTVNIASRLQNLAASRTILTTSAIAKDSEAMALIDSHELKMGHRYLALRGIREEVATYEIG